MLSLLLALVDSEEERIKIEELYYTYQDLMYGIAFNILNHPQNTEDAVFSSWEKIISHLDKIGEVLSGSTKGFITIIVERTAIDLYRKLKKYQEVPLLFEETAYFAVRDIEMENTEVMLWIHSLKKKYAEVLLLYYVNNCSLKEIASLLNLTEGTVSRRLKKARELLKQKL